MKWRRIAKWAAAAALLSVVWVCYAAEETTASEKMDVRLLYVGKPDSSREKDFVEFLTKHFKEVKTGDLAKFSESQTDGFDVVVLDWEGDGFKAPRPQLSRQYARSTITVGVAGAIICDRLGLKSGYL